jgi:hypothetical protein
MPVRPGAAIAWTMSRDDTPTHEASGVSLGRDVEGHLDRGWRVDEEPNG